MQRVKEALKKIGYRFIQISRSHSLWAVVVSVRFCYETKRIGVLNAHAIGDLVVDMSNVFPIVVWNVRHLMNDAVVKSIYIEEIIKNQQFKK